MLRVASLRGYPMDFEAADREALSNFARGLQSFVTARRRRLFF